MTSLETELSEEACCGGGADDDAEAGGVEDDGDAPLVLASSYSSLVQNDRNVYAIQKAASFRQYFL